MSSLSNYIDLLNFNEPFESGFKNGRNTETALLKDSLRCAAVQELTHIDYKDENLLSHSLGRILALQ